MMTELKRAGGNEPRDFKELSLAELRRVVGGRTYFEMVLTPAFSAARLLRQASSITAAGVM